MSKRIPILPYALVDPRNAGGDIERYVKARFAEKYQSIVEKIKVEKYDSYHVRVYVNQPKKTLPDEVFEFAWEVADELTDKGYDVLVILRETHPVVLQAQAAVG